MSTELRLTFWMIGFFVLVGACVFNHVPLALLGLGLILTGKGY